MSITSEYGCAQKNSCGSRVNTTLKTDDLFTALKTTGLMSAKNPADKPIVKEGDAETLWL